MMWYSACLFFSALQVQEALASILGVARTGNAFQFPIYKSTTNPLKKRDSERRIMGLGYRDQRRGYYELTVGFRSYTTLMTIGRGVVPLVIDTGSSDLWVISESCTEDRCLQTGVPLYPQNTFQSNGMQVQLFYVGRDVVGLTGASISNQLFASINDTNTTVLETDAAGIFGLGFPVNSQIWLKTFEEEHPMPSSHKRRSIPKSSSSQLQSSFPNLDRFRGAYTGDSTNSDIDNEDSSTNPRSPSSPLLQPQRKSEEPLGSSSSWTPLILDSFSQNGPPLTRSIAQLGMEPRFSVTLQRDTVQLGGNAGILTVGGLPDGIKEEALTWVPVRRYSPAQGGLSPPPDSPDEVYPIAWEIPIDAVFLNGQELPRSNLTSSDISVTALIDTGNSRIRAQQDVVDTIYSLLPRNQREGTDPQSYLCNQPISLTFQIGGNMFPVDPRDFGIQLFEDSVEDCVGDIAVTDTPVEGNGFLYSWNLGTPFLKSVLASFHYGNITHPSQDPPRIGFLSTVPDDAEDRYREAVEAAANSNGGNFPAYNH
ncbi:acid protease [Dendrothele bispora CBS 962.96]|uniref:Acid protease n=1 Tax=Dendrothele bispora (strain CBS 962.96) TaxID=1314807 RepID=A0A4S8MCP0_DENBC|nr:acid protease [Dendrothele bispora CBS 962.96]